MEIEITNKILIRGAPYPFVDNLIRYLTINNPVYEEAISLDRSVYGIPRFIYNFENIYGGIAIPRGCRQRLFRELERSDISKYNLIDSRKKFKYIHIDSSAIKFRPYQYSPVIDLITKSDEGMLVAPAGSGKTVIGLSVIAIAGQPTLWLTHTKRLLKQAVQRAEKFLPSIEKDDYGIIGKGKWNVGNILTVALVQTLARNEREEQLKELKDRFGLIILDEAHHCPASTFFKVISQLNPYYLYGLTATPYRRDGLEIIMFQTLGEATAVIKTKEVEKHGGIVIPTVRLRSVHRPTNSGMVMESNVPSIMNKYIIDNDSRNHMIVGDVVREASMGNFCIVISGRKVHCETLHELISAGWPKTGIATGDYSEKYQDEQVKRFYDGDITVLVTTFELLGEGFDIDFLNRAFVATSFRAEGRVEQLIGRIQRSAEGKSDAIVYDYVDVDIGVLKDQFYNRKKNSRSKAYARLGVVVEPY